MATEREASLEVEIRHLQRMLVMAQDTIAVQCRTSDRFWTIICELLAGKEK